MAHEQREEAKHKTLLLRERAEKDLAQYATDIKDLQRSAENDFILKEFMELKNQEREEKATHGQHAKKVRRREMELLVEKCETSWDRIKEISGTDDLEPMLASFQETESENFGLFNFINELNNIIEEESEGIEHLKLDFKAQSSEMMMGDEERNAFLDEVETKVEKEKAVNAEKAAQLAESNAQFDELKSGIQHMLDQLDINVAIASNADLLESLGDIEERINELIAAKAMLMEELDPENQSAIKHILVPDPPALPIEEPPLLLAPSTGAGQEIHDIEIEPEQTKTIDNMPMTLSQMREKVKAKKDHGPSSSRAQMRKASMRPAPEVLAKTSDVDTS